MIFSSINFKLIKGLIIECTFIRKSPLNPSLSKRGIIPPFDKGRLGGIL